mgnify:CR=1 FL=1
MQYLNFMNIFGIILLAISIMNMVSVFDSVKNLGPLVRPTLNGFKYVDKTQLIFITLIVIMLGLSIGTAGINSDTIIYYIAIAGSGVTFVIVYFKLLSIAPGFYKNGVATGTSILNYSNIRVYDLDPKKNEPDIIKVYFNKGGLLSASQYVCINKKDQGEVKAYLKKRIHK